MAPLLAGVGFITGAASGIGKATAYAFAKHGVRRLALGDINLDAIKATAAELGKEHKDLEILPLSLDVGNEHSINDAVAITAAEFGCIDYAVNNAGIAGPLLRSAEHSKEDWQKVMNVNLNGVWMSQRAEIRQMLKQDIRDTRHGRGVIVNTASMYGVIGTSMNTPAVAYTTSKHAVLGLTKADAIAYARDGIRINAICPGYVATPLLKSVSNHEAMQAEMERTPMARFAEMEEIADSIVFLASRMSSFMTGAHLVADGGFTIQ